MIKRPGKNPTTKSLAPLTKPVKEPLKLETGIFFSGKIPFGKTILAGVSGGSDSVALLHLLIEKAPTYKQRIICVHVDHGLRPDAIKDAEFVENLAAKLKVEFVLLKVDCLSKGLSPEEAARKARLTALFKLAKQKKAGAIALGHTANDQAETILTRVLTGTGPTGLSGIRANNGLLWRPLLTAKREELKHYLRKLNQSWQTDPTNNQTIFLRNRVRNKIMPLALDLINPKAIEASCRLADLCAEEEDFWQNWLENSFKKHANYRGTSLEISINWLKTLHKAQLKRALRCAVSKIGNLEQGLPCEHITRLMDLVQGKVGRQLNLPYGLWAGKEPDFLRLDVNAQPGEFSVIFHGPGCMHLQYLRKKIVIQESPKPGTLKARGDSVWIPYSAIFWPLTIRTIKPKDRFQAMGAPGSKKVAHFLKDLKLPFWFRKRTFVVESAGKIIWTAPWSLAEIAREKTGKENLGLSIRLIDTNS